MKRIKKVTPMILSMTFALSLGAVPINAAELKTTAPVSTTDLSKLKFENNKWNYDATNDVYWQIGVQYSTNPVALDYETMGIYVPGAYMTGTKNADGTYTCEINKTQKVGGYTAETAPMVIPVNTPGYAPQKAPTSYNYETVSSYLEAGFIYLYPGCRGKDNDTDANGNFVYSGGAPWGVTDIKAAIRYVRYNEDLLPGDTDRIFTFGMSGGGAQSSLLGASGDSELYIPYLQSIGAAIVDDNGEPISDAVLGSMAWCPITSLDSANEAYEWMMGQYSTTGTRAEDTWTSALSDDLSNEFATYINQLGLVDENGNALTLEPSETGIYNDGSYYDYILAEIQRSLNNFLTDTSFPYTSGGSSAMGGGFGGERPTGDIPDEIRANLEAEGRLPNGGFIPQGGQADTTAVTYQTPQEYIDSLNSDGVWVEYDSATNTAKITSIKDFVNHCKTATKDVGAFDGLDRSNPENAVFGDDNTNGLHFDSTMAELLAANQEEYATFSDWQESYVNDYQEYLNSVDGMGNDSLTRQNMYNPMYYISDSYEGYGTSTTAEYWRIRSGIAQGDTSLTVETNLALALEQLENVEDVDFETVWDMKHVKAERTGDSTDNFIEWVNECLLTTTESKSDNSTDINSEKVTSNVTTINSNGVDYYPLRECLEEVGATVKWVPETKTINVTLGENKVTFTLNSDIYYVNGQEKQMDTGSKAFIKNGITYIPVKCVEQLQG